MGWMRGCMVKVKLLTDIEIGKTGEIVNVTPKSAKMLIDENEAEYIKQEETTKSSKHPKTEDKKVKQHEETTTKIKDTKTMEPVLINNIPKWLIITEKETTIDTGRSIKEILKSPGLTETIKIFNVEDEGIWQCKKCSAKIVSNPNEPVYCTECKRKSTFEPVTDVIDTTLWKLPRWKNIDIEDIDMQNTYLDLVQIIKDAVVFSDEIYYHILALWIIASWKQDQWNTIPFLIFRGLIESGKTRALEILRELGYRMMHTGGTTFPALVRATDVYNAGVLLDEIDNKIDKRTESGRAMIDFLKESYKAGSYYRVADLDNQKKIKSYSNYGFKAFAGEKGGYDDAIFSRSIDFQMEQNYPEIDDMRDVEEDTNRIKTILLNYRYKTNNPPKLPDDLILKGRDREIFACIIRTAIHIGVDYQNIVNFIIDRKKEKEEEYQNTQEYQLLKAVKELENIETLDDAPEVISYSDLANHLGWEDKQRQSIGYIFKKKLQLKTKRKNTGAVLLLNDSKNARKLKAYFKRFKL